MRLLIKIIKFLYASSIFIVNVLNGKYKETPGSAFPSAERA